jgi:hypothetical protein
VRRKEGVTMMSGRRGKTGVGETVVDPFQDSFAGKAKRVGVPP